MTTTTTENLLKPTDIDTSSMADAVASDRALLTTSGGVDESTLFVERVVSVLNHVTIGRLRP